VTEGQLTSGLIELKVYGIVSLYTSPEAPPVDPNAVDPKKEKDKDPKDKDPKDKGTALKESPSKDPMGKDPTSKDPMPTAPMGKDSKTPKMRIRRIQRTVNHNRTTV
jgi:hypothetical protein